MQRFILSGLLLVLSVVAHSQIYKWVDQEGNIQYTDQPPQPGTAKDASKLNYNSPVSPPSDNNASSSARIDEEMRAFKKRRISKQEEESKQQTQADENKKKCHDAQGKLTVFRDTPRLRLPNGNGEVVYVDDDVREKNILEAQKNITKYCK